MLIRRGFDFIDEPEEGLHISSLPECGKCGLYKHCLEPKMKIDGQGKKKILLCAEAPGEEEDKQGKPLVGPTGTYLKSVLARLGIDMRTDCWMINSLSCRPKNNTTPTDRQISHCRPKVINHIKETNPEHIILLGGPAIKSVLGWLWRDKVGKVSRWVGWNIPCQSLNCWVSPVYHPSYIKRSENKRTGKLDPVLEGLFEKSLRQALSKKGRPWEEGKIPDFRKMVKIELVPKQVKQLLGGFIKMGDPIAFDFETEGFKPDGDGAPEIVTCAVSNGIITYAYPWHGQAIEATKDLLLSDIPKIGANIKYEERFVRRYLGIEVNNWVLDTVVAAHVLDNRAGICGLKFQSFVRLGQPVYNTAVSKYLRAESKGGYCKNKIREGMRIARDKILLYNGLDALLSIRVAEQQAKELGIDLRGNKDEWSS